MGLASDQDEVPSFGLHVVGSGFIQFHIRSESELFTFADWCALSEDCGLENKLTAATDESMLRPATRVCRCG